MWSFDYISKKGEKNLSKYKYVGCVNSIIYTYLFSPMAEWVVKYTPEWVAPNLMTVVGFLHAIASHVLLMSEDKPAPWKFVVASWLYLVYSMMDNADGKQARKIKMSSPLGLVLDHGCDAFVLVITTLNMIKIFHFDPEKELFSICVGFAFPLIVFFISTWEQLNTGVLNMRLLMGPDEAVVLIILAHLMEAWQPGYMTSTYVFGVRLNVATTASFGFCCLALFLLSLKAVSKAGVGLLQAAVSTLPFFLDIVLGLGWILTSTEGIYTQAPLSSLWLIGLVFCKLVIHMQVAHVADEGFYPWRKTLFVPTVIFTLNRFWHFASELVCLRLALAVTALSALHMSYGIVAQMMRVLKVPFLTVPRKRNKD